MIREGYLERWKRKTEGKRYSPPVGYDITFNEIVRNIANENYSLLDIGTGTGKVIFDNNLPKLYKKVVGIGIDKDMINACREKARGMNNVEFALMDFRKLEFEGNYFNVVICMFAPYLASEVSRVLVPGGNFVLLYSLKGDHKELTALFPDFYDMGDRKMKFETLGKRRKDLKKAGLKVILENSMKYRMLFRDEKALKEFYQKILFRPIFEGRENKLAKLKRESNGEIPITRIIGTIVARKI